MRRSRALALAAATLLAASLTVAETLSASAATTSFGSGAASFVTSTAPAYDGSSFFQSDAAGEPSIGLDWKTGAAMYMAGTDTYKVTFDNTTGAASWADRSSPYSVFNLDPILATEHTSGLTLAGGDNGACAVMSSTTNDGGSAAFDSSAWTPTLPCPLAVDHPTVGFGPFAGGTPIGATGSFASYFCQQEALLDECSHSWDGGLTWSPSVPDTNLDCESLFGHIKASPDGTAYIPNSNCFDANSNLVVGGLTTTDNGLTLGGYGIAGAPTPARGFDPSIATTSDNTVYETWSRAGDYHPVVASSTDHGKTWSAQTDLASTVPGLTAATFESAVGGDAGRVAIAFLGTKDTDQANTPFDPAFKGQWELYVAYTYDGGATWTTTQVTPDSDPVQIGGINDGGFSSTDHRNLLDFMDASATKDGRVVVAYADGCPPGCTTSADSSHARASVAYQLGGEGLFAAYDGGALAAAPATTTTTNLIGRLTKH
ncbi:MAG TPA: sialidase family protein [Mycobacteriales bacterium]|jgi:hypothetical protein|nr:sialidase family protein [Mycobacteriales bacterium]